MSAARDQEGRDADLRALTLLRPLLPDHYLPWTSASLRPAAVAAICNDVVIRGRRHVVECGSGISTLVLARLLADVGGSLLSIEHDETWAEVVEGLVRRSGLTGTVRVLHAPLEGGWYDREVVGKALSAEDAPEVFDLLLVDGPPAWRPGTGLARLPAAEVLALRLSPSATIVLDDADRPGEQAVMADWRERFGWELTHRADGTAMAVLTADGYTV